MNYSFKISGLNYNLLKAHLFPGDNLEAVALALCGRLESESEIIYLLHEVITISYDKCEVRTKDKVKWYTEGIIDVLQKAVKRKLSVLKIHSHPTGLNNFSQADDISDKELYSSVFGWMDESYSHLSAVMLPDGEIFGRAVLAYLGFLYS